MLRSKIVIVCLFVFSATAIVAQDNADLDPKKFNVGFILGGNYSFMHMKANNPTTLDEITNKPGFGLGIGAEFRLYKGLYIAPSAMFKMGGSDVSFPNRDTQNEYEVMPMSVGVNANFQYKFTEGTNEPYVILGGAFDIPVQRVVGSTEFGNGPNFGLNIGMGLSHWFNSFMLAPELVYSHGFSNINENPLISTEAGLYLSQISLRFKFMG